MHHAPPSAGPSPARFLLTLSVTDRANELWPQLESIAAARERSVLAEHLRVPGSLSVLVIDNCSEERQREGIREAQQRALQVGLQVHAVHDGQVRRSIAQSRAAQVEHTARLMRAGVLERPDIVWMLDDDLRFERLAQGERGLEVRRDVDHFGELARLQQQHPHASVGLGGVSESPPIRPEAIVRGHLFDLVSTLNFAATLRPDEPYRLPSCVPPARTADFYYDHSEADTDHLHTPFLWTPDPSLPSSARDQMRAFVALLPAVLRGSPCTRLLIDNGPTHIDLDPTPLSSPRRGGNAVFFKLDAFLAHAYPEVELAPGLRSRRADMIGATLLAQAGTHTFHGLRFTLRHVRGESQGRQAAPGQLTRSLRGEFAGILLARRTMSKEADPVEALAERRLARIAENAREALKLARALRGDLERPKGWPWSDPQIAQGLEEFLGQLDEHTRAAYGADSYTPAPDPKTWLRERLELPSLCAAVSQAEGALQDEAHKHQARIRALLSGDQP